MEQKKLMVLLEDMSLEEKLRILELKNNLGLFENPYKDADEEEERKLILCEEHRRIAKETVVESIVLLKNDGILPIAKNDQKIAFIGPYVSNQCTSSAWSIFAKTEDNISLDIGILNLGIKNVSFSKGCPIMDSLEGLMMNPQLEGVEEDIRNKEKLLTEAIEHAKNANIIVMTLGEHAQQSGEAASRSDISISEGQMELFRKIHKINPNIIVVLYNGRPLTIKELSDKAKAVLEVWLPGTEGGNAIAEVLFGIANPSGKLSMSFPYNVGQVPVFYSEFHTGRPYVGQQAKYLSKYIDAPNAPLYPFGYGLSYTQFIISEVTLSSTKLSLMGKLEASVVVKNVGNRIGKEVIQMYIQDVHGSVVRPVRELKGFQKVELQPGEARKVSFTITEEMLKFYNIDMNYTSESGEFNLFIGNSSETKNGLRFIL